MSITGMISGKLPVAKVVARESHNAKMVAALYHCSKSLGAQSLIRIEYKRRWHIFLLMPEAFTSHSPGAH